MGHRSASRLLAQANGDPTPRHPTSSGPHGRLACAVDDPEHWAEAALLLADCAPLDANRQEWTIEEVGTLLRAAYGVGYCDALKSRHPLTEQEARVALARLKLALPDP